jgi:hypothetical protein
VVTGIAFIVIGLGFAAGGGWLIALGGSWYYLAAGIGLALTGLLLLRRSAAALWLRPGAGRDARLVGLGGRAGRLAARAQGGGARAARAPSADAVDHHFEANGIAHGLFRLGIGVRERNCGRAECRLLRRSAATGPAGSSSPLCSGAPAVSPQRCRWA